MMRQTTKKPKRKGRPPLPPELRKVSLTITIPRDLRERLKAAAKRERTTMSGVIRALMELLPR